MALEQSYPRRRPSPTHSSEERISSNASLHSLEGDLSQSHESPKEPQSSSITNNYSMLTTSLDDKFVQRRSMTLYRVHSDGEGIEHPDAGDLGNSNSQEQLNELEDIFSSQEHRVRDQTQTDAASPCDSIRMGGTTSRECLEKTDLVTGSSRRDRPPSYRRSHGRAPGMKTLYGDEFLPLAISSGVKPTKPKTVSQDTDTVGGGSSPPGYFGDVQLPKESTSDMPTGSTPKHNPEQVDIDFSKTINKFKQETKDSRHTHRASIDWRRRVMAFEPSTDRLSPTSDSTSIPHSPPNSFANDRMSMSTAVDSVYVNFDHFSQSEKQNSDFSKEEDYTDDYPRNFSPEDIVHISKKKVRILEGRNVLRFVLGLASSFVAAILAGLYLYLRYRYMVKVLKTTSQRYTEAWVFLALESLVWTSLGLSGLYDVLSQLPRRTSHVSGMRIKSEAHLPIVDIYIITSGFPDPIVMDTVAATLALDYPPSRYRVIVIDNSQGSNLQRQIERFRNRPMNLLYQRVVGDDSMRHRCHPSGYAIQFALQQPTPRNPSPFIAILDGDMIPELGFLRSLVPHMVQDPMVGLVACPMAYYNLPKFLQGPTATLLEMSGTLVRPRDTTLHGIRSGIILRRSALRDIGGFPAYSCIDDGAVVSLLNQKGYRSVVVKEPAQCGTAPLDFVTATSHLSALRFGPFKIAASSGSFGARICGLFEPICRTIFSFLIFCGIVSIPLQFFSSTVLVPVLKKSQLVNLIQMSAMMLFAFSLRDSIWCTRSSTPTFRRRLQTWAFVAPYDMIVIISRLNPFRSTRYINASRVEAPSTRLRRIRRATTTGLAWLHLLLAITIAASVIYKIVLLATNRREMGTIYQTGLLAIISGSFWPTLVFVDIWLGLMTPLTLALKSSRIPFREDLLIRDPFTMVARPKLTSRTYYPFIVVHSPMECVISLMFAAYNLFLLGLSFFQIQR
ncbi:family 2 glycosyltransferase [Melampsora larici-populina 98AG31]|uniref:Family 2 glycosyltransferase n=1 Tax=Melampsora larici-populina (strain 98AG31 / pathotype 3-4-7) TaxID=747676 RepID=F4S4D1_MELLP|nr:family 2 glycosyltransferase [Melampsora larici-populina 98AG31]EGG00507.1 family 2 glycosyltransferase [Melampsora larici-populina 98AG31]